MALVEKPVIILGIMPGLDLESVQQTRDKIQESFPNHIVRVVAGMLSAFEFTTMIEVDDEPTPGAEAERKGAGRGSADELIGQKRRSCTEYRTWLTHPSPNCASTWPPSLIG